MKYAFQCSSQDAWVCDYIIFGEQKKIGHIYRGKPKFSLEFICLDVYESSKEGCPGSYEYMNLKLTRDTYGYRHRHGTINVQVLWQEVSVIVPSDPHLLTPHSV